jgi:hypothetical protein
MMGLVNIKGNINIYKKVLQLHFVAHYTMVLLSVEKEML